MKFISATLSLQVCFCVLVLGFLPAFGQGVDDCTNAQPIAGEGTWSVDTTSAVTDGPADACGQSSDIHNDVWFRWTATVTEDHLISTCPGADFDTVIAIYDGGGCPAAGLIVCNDDSCGLQSQVMISAVAGTDYLLRVGGWSSANSGMATMEVEAIVNLPNDDCSAPIALSGYGTFNTDTSMALTEGPSNGCGQGGQIHNDLWFAWTAPLTEDAELSTCGASWDTTVAIYDGLACPVGAPLACNDDSCSIQTRVAFPAVAGNAYLLRIGGWNSSASGVLDFTLDASTNVGCSTPPVGPDVIIGDLPSVHNYGGLGGIGAYALATTACNVGDSTMNWNGSNALHPVIGSNLYRVEGGRIEQLGLSWLKHGFASATGTYCCTCISPGSSQIMGIGCSDPYGATTNGAQPSLGPRSEIDPWTGVFPYPFTSQGQSGDLLFKRLQVPNSELDPSSHVDAAYVLEGQYVTPDDSIAGNQHNNVSWTHASVGGFSNGSFELAVVGETRQVQPAVFAWQEIDPLVRIESAAPAGDGMFLVASRAYDNGDGTWRYEYAVYNQISARAAGSFAVPIQPGAAVTLAGFKDVEHHSGEVWDGADWSYTASFDRVQWNTLDYSVSPLANAIRWGTLYNFTLTADVAPVDGMIELGLFVPGSEDSLAIGAVVPGVAGFGERTCSPAAVNSVGQSAAIFALGSSLASDNDLTLLTLGMATNQFGYCLASQSGAFVPNPGGSAGNLCLGSPIARFVSQVQNSGGSGSFSVAVDLTSIPSTPVHAVVAGETWYFQTWYRDSVLGIPTSNFSDGIRIGFQ